METIRKIMGWGPWRDISTDYRSGSIFLLQYRRHINGKVKFRVEQSDTYFGQKPALKDLWGHKDVIIGDPESDVSFVGSCSDNVDLDTIIVDTSRPEPISRPSIKTDMLRDLRAKFGGTYGK